MKLHSVNQASRPNLQQLVIHQLVHNHMNIEPNKGKLFKIRDFVKEEDRQEFSTLFFKGDWETARNLLLYKYSYAFTVNKKRELSCAFDGNTSLRGFFIDKMDAISTYTSLNFKNQIEIILADLPNEISNLFIIKDKMNSSKADILKFCDSIQEFANSLNAGRSGSTTPIPPSEHEDEVVQEMEIFCESNPGFEVESVSGLSSSSQHSRRRNKVHFESSPGQGRPPKKMKSRHMVEESETSQSDTTIQSVSSRSSDF